MVMVAYKNEKKIIVVENWLNKTNIFMSNLIRLVNNKIIVIISYYIYCKKNYYIIKNG